MIRERAAAQNGQGSTAAPVSYGDPYGFIATLNSIRAQYGLPAVSYDANLSAWATQNNAAQSQRGLGHFVNPVLCKIVDGTTETPLPWPRVGCPPRTPRRRCSLGSPGLGSPTAPAPIGR